MAGDQAQPIMIVTASNTVRPCKCSLSMNIPLNLCRQSISCQPKRQDNSLVRRHFLSDETALIYDPATMKPTFLLTLLLGAASPLLAQLPTPNADGVTAGHHIFRAKDVDAANKFWMTLGGEPAA